MNWFDEKTIQVNPSELRAFGIAIQSRYGNAAEMAEMLCFARECAAASVEKFVVRVFYDSKACIGSIVLHAMTDIDGHAGVTILDAAKRTLGQFEWDGCVYHKDDAA